MAERESFVFYRSFAEALEDLDDATFRQVVSSLASYALDGELPDVTGVASAIFKLMKPQIDANNKRYENGKSGGRPKNQTETKQEPNDNQNITKPKPKHNQTETKQEPNTENAKPNVNVNVNVNDNDNVLKDIYTGSVSTLPDASAQKPEKKSEPKHRHGEYRHVMLTDKELERLKMDYGEQNALEAIQYLDEYIEMKGYKAKSHYLAMRKWVFSALDEERQRRRRAGPVAGQNSGSGRSAPKNREYDYDGLERELLARGIEDG